MQLAPGLAACKSSDALSMQNTECLGASVEVVGSLPEKSAKLPKRMLVPAGSRMSSLCPPTLQHARHSLSETLVHVVADGY